MTDSPYAILDRKRRGETLSEAHIRALVAGTVDGSWSDAQLAAFLMAVTLGGLRPEETRQLTLAMLESGEAWDLASDVPGLTDKHSTGGVGDKVSLVLGPLLAACDIPVAMLTGRGLGHTGGTADKLEVIPGLDLELDRARSVDLLERVGLAIGVATAEIAPADRRLYALRDQTATVESMPLITASILSKKLASGADVLVFDVKTGEGAFMVDPGAAEELARGLVATATAMGRRSSALVTDMSQPLGDWVGHAAEIRETLDCLAGEGPPETMAVVYALAEEMAGLAGSPISRERLEATIASGAARRAFDRWALAQGAAGDWLDAPDLTLAPVEVVIAARRDGVLAAVSNRLLGLLLAQAGGGRVRADSRIDAGVALRFVCRIGTGVRAGDELARLYLRRDDPALVERFEACFEIGEVGEAPQLIRKRITASGADSSSA